MKNYSVLDFLEEKKEEAKKDTVQDKDIKDRKGSQPKKYYKGLAKSTKEKRATHFKKGAAMSDDDPRAYKKAPGDARAKTKESEYTKKYKEKYGEEVENDSDILLENPDKSLKKKAEKSGIAFSILKQVYKRGVAAWRTGHRPGTTPEQWGHARVNSFLVGGKTRRTADADLWKKHKGK